MIKSIYNATYLMCRVGATHFKEEGLAGWVNEQFDLVQLAPKRQAYKTVNNEV